MINRQSNLYTIIYSAVLVLAVGVTLALIYQALRPAQAENIANDTRRQILAAARIAPAKGESVSDLYKKHVTAEFIVNIRGEHVEAETEPFDVNIGEESRTPADKRLLPVFECKTDNGVKYILPVYGAGLWGPIWGYIAFDDNGDTIYGAYFAHQGETPGLGAEIEKTAFSSQFDGKNIFNTKGDFTSVLVVKAGREPAGDLPYVHAISGGTVTSTGVQKMLKDSLEPYTAFLKKLASTSHPQSLAHNTADISSADGNNE